MKVLSKLVIFSIVLFSTKFSFAEETGCYEKNLSYPHEMFGQFANRKHVAALEIYRVFRFKKNNMPQKPADILRGFAYLEVFLNELCYQRQNHKAQMSREKMIDIILDTRLLLGLGRKTPRQKVINFYWGTGINNLGQKATALEATKIISAVSTVETKSQARGFDNFSSLIDTAVLQYGTGKRVMNGD